MDQDSSSDFKKIRLAALERQRRQLEEEQRVELQFVALVRELRESVLADSLSRGVRFTVAGPATSQAAGEPSDLTLVVLPRAVATGSAARQSEWWDLVIGKHIPPAIVRFPVSQPIPREEYEQIRRSTEEVVGLTEVMANRRHFGLKPQVMVDNLRRAIMLYQLMT